MFFPQLLYGTLIIAFHLFWMIFFFPNANIHSFFLQFSFYNFIFIIFFLQFKWDVFAVILFVSEIQFYKKIIK